MILPPAVRVHGFADAQAALALARPVTLLSGPGAALYMGCLWWERLLARLAFTGPALLDCADAPGRALEALKLGLGGVVLSCDAARFAQVAEIAAGQGALVLPSAPPALDLAERGAAWRLATWLGG